MNGEMPYKERLLSLNLPLLSCERDIKDLKFCYKVLFGFVNVNPSNFISLVCHGRTRLSRSSENGELKQVTFLSTWMPAGSKLNHYRWRLMMLVVLV